MRHFNHQRYHEADTAGPSFLSGPGPGSSELTCDTFNRGPQIKGSRIVRSLRVRLLTLCFFGKRSVVCSIAPTFVRLPLPAS